MKVISSKTTFVSKKLFPAAWFGFLGIFIATAVFSGTAKDDPGFLVVPVIMLVFGYFLMKKLVWDLADEVVDYGDYLQVRYKDQQDIVYLNNIMNVSVSSNQNPPRITLRLRTPGKFGQEVAFTPVSKFSFNLFKKNEVAEDLIVRVDKARG